MGPGSFDPGNVADRLLAEAGISALQWGRGLSTPEMNPDLPPLPEKPSFNGAGVFRPRKSALFSAPLISSLELQWGRGLSTPEMPETDQ